MSGVGHSSKDERPPQIVLDDLAAEIKTNIASFLNRADAVNLGLANRAWNEATQPVIWRTVAIDTSSVDLRIDEEEFSDGYERRPHIAKQWSQLEKALKARPGRHDLVRTLVTETTDRSASTMVRVLCRLPNLTHLRHNSWGGEDTSPREGWCHTLPAIQARLMMGPTFTALKTLELEVSRWVDCGINDILEQMPELENLGLYMRGVDDISGSVDTFSLTALPSLQRLRLRMDDWWDFVPGDAGCLTSLTIDRRDEVRRLETIWEEGERDNGRGTTLSWLGGYGLTRLEVNDEDIEAEIFDRDEVVPEIWLPKLQSLRLAVQDYMYARDVPPHPTITSLALVMYHPAVPNLFTYIGTRPSDQVTGFMSSSTIRYIRKNPCLTYLLRTTAPDVRPGRIDADDPFSAPTWESKGDGLYIRTFTNDHIDFSETDEHGDRLIGTLYHARCRPNRANWDYLCAHGAAYHPISGGHFPPKLVLPGYVSGLRDGRDVPYGEAWDNLDRGPDALGEWVDLTSYKGFALPHVLLDYVYTFVPGGREWTEGSRGDSLPRSVWKLLERWVRIAKKDMRDELAKKNMNKQEKKAPRKRGTPKTRSTARKSGWRAFQTRDSGSGGDEPINDEEDVAEFYRLDGVQ